MFRSFAFICMALMLAVAGCTEPAATQSTASSGETEVVPAKAYAAGNLQLGDRLPPFELETIDGEPVRLADYLNGEQYVAVIWHAPTCPCAKNCAIAVRDAMSGPEYEDVAFIGVASGPMLEMDWYEDDLRAQIDEGVLTYPVGMDRDDAVRELYGADRTPTVWLADRDGIIRFYGAPETTLEVGAEGYRVLLKEAIDDLKAGREVATPVFDPIGCLI